MLGALLVALRLLDTVAVKVAEFSAGAVIGAFLGFAFSLLDVKAAASCLFDVLIGGLFIVADFYCGLASFFHDCVFGRGLPPFFGAAWLDVIVSELVGFCY